MRSTDRAIALLALFTAERPVWTVEDAAQTLAVAPSTLYRTLNRLVEAGWLTSVSPGRYTLGPAVIAADRLVQQTDPLLQAAMPVMHALAAQSPDGSTLVLARLFGDSVMCVHQILARGPQPLISYARGRPLSLFRGAGGKAILGRMTPAQLRRLYTNHAEEIAAGGLGSDWPSFRAACARIRRAGVAITHAELDPGRIGIAAPVVSPLRRVLGSFGLALSDRLQETVLRRTQAEIVAAAREIEARLRAEAIPVAARA